MERPTFHLRWEREALYIRKKEEKKKKKRIHTDRYRFLVRGRIEFSTISARDFEYNTDIGPCHLIRLIHLVADIISLQPSQTQPNEALH